MRRTIRAGSSKPEAAKEGKQMFNSRREGGASGHYHPLPRPTTKEWGEGWGEGKPRNHRLGGPPHPAPLLSMNRKTALLISKHLRFPGSWSHCMRERERRLPMNFTSAERGSVSRSNLGSGRALRLTEPRSVRVAGFRGAMCESVRRSLTLKPRRLSSHGSRLNPSAVPG